MLSGQPSPLWQMLVIDFWSLQKEERLDEDHFERPLEDQIATAAFSPRFDVRFCQPWGNAFCFSDVS